MKTPSPQEADKWAREKKEQAPMTPPQKQPAVTREEVLDLISDIDECSNCQESDACFVYRRNEMIERLLAERDEALREVERLKEHGTLVCQDMENDALKKELSAEKRRAAAYRELAMILELLRFNGMKISVDAEAQKLLADSGGEKDFKSQQKGDSKK